MAAGPATTLDAQARQRADDAGVAFVRELAEAVTKGPVELPGFPEVALRLQELLADDSVNSDAVVRLVGAEPMLAARVVSLANSAAMNPSSNPVNDLRTAVARLGFDSLRAAAVSFAVAQLRRRDEYRSIEPQLSQLWVESVCMAATSEHLRRAGVAGVDRFGFGVDGRHAEGRRTRLRLAAIGRRRP